MSVPGEIVAVTPEGGATGCSWVKARDVAKCPAVHGKALQAKNDLACIVLVPRLRNKG